MQSEIELRQMRYFLAVAEERSFTRASRRCDVAQPSLSRQIRALELSLGTRVFERLSREIRVTPAGKVFEQEAMQALGHCRRAVSLVRALEREKSQQLKIGLSALSDLPRMLALMRKAQKAASELSMECRQDNTADLLLELLRGKLDLAIVELPSKERGISAYPVHSEPLIAMLPQGHFLSARPMVRLFELKKEQVALVSGKTDPTAVVIDAMLQQAGVAPRKPCRV